MSQELNSPASPEGTSDLSQAVPLGRAHPDHENVADVAGEASVALAANARASAIFKGIAAETLSEACNLVTIAGDVLGVSMAASLLPDEFKVEFEQHAELRSVTVGENDRTWFCDRAVFGDAVEFVRIGFDDPNRLAAARRILEWVKTLPKEVQQSLRPRRLESSQQAQKFPTVLLPAVLANFITEVARVRDVPIEVLVPAVLGVMSGATGKGLRLKSVGGMTVLPNLFFLAGAFSGMGKSVASAVAFNPVHEYERRIQAKHALGIAAMKVALTKVQREITDLASGENGETGPSTVLTDLRAREKDLLAALRPPRYVVEDITGEAFAALLASNQGFAFSLSPDARSVFKILIGRYRAGSGGGSDEDLYLKLFSEDEMRQDRITRESVAVKAAAAVVWLTQLDNIALMFAKEALTTSGLACRFLVTRASFRRRDSTYEELTLDTSVVGAYERRVWELMETYYERREEPLVISASTDARRLIIDFDHEIEARKEVGDFDDLIGFASRWAEMSWKLALALHATEHGREAHTTSVSVQNAHAAVEIIKWFARQQQDILGEAADEKVDERLNAARKLVQASPGGTTPRLLQKTDGRLFPSSEEARKALEALVGEGGAFKHGAGKRPKYCPQRAPKG